MKENNYQEKKNDITFYQSVKKSIKNNYKIIILILLILILVIIITNMNINKYYLNKNIKIGGAQMTNQIASSGLGLYTSIVSKCTSGTFIASAQRFNAIMDNLTYVIVFILAIIIIPAFPIVFYIGIVYAIIYNLIGNIIKS